MPWTEHIGVDAFDGEVAESVMVNFPRLLHAQLEKRDIMGFRGSLLCHIKPPTYVAIELVFGSGYPPPFWV